MRRMFLCSALSILLLAFTLISSAAWAQAAPAPAKADDVISLPKPTTTGGMALTEALAHRRSIRSFTATPLTIQELSQLLWAAQGITDPSGKRTAPSAHAQYYLKVYALTADGVFEYLPQGHQLKKLSATDVRQTICSQAQVKGGAVVLLIAGDFARAQKNATAEAAARFVNLEAGHCAQNVLLQATALGLGAVPAGGIEPDKIQQAVPLPTGFAPIYLIPVGHPK